MESATVSFDSKPEDPGISPPNPTPTWTYPTRMCRICREDVVPTVTMYPPGLPPAFQRPVVEYKSEDEYGRLVKPCNCRGGMRYIHEHCLLRCRTEGVRPGSLWKCHECGYQFNFKRLHIQRYLGSKISSSILTAMVMVLLVFILGFVADPIINLYVDPLDTIIGNEYYWQEVDVNYYNDNLSGWGQHFLKGLVSMGLVGFLKTMLLNPFQWWNLRNTGFVSGRSSGRRITGRDRAVNISWIAVVIGISSAFYFFYQWVQAIIGRALQRLGNNIVDTQLPGDDEDLKPPPGFQFGKQDPNTDNSEEETNLETPNSVRDQFFHTDSEAEADLTSNPVEILPEQRTPIFDAKPLSDITDKLDDEADPAIRIGRPLEEGASVAAFSSALDNARTQTWSFKS